MGDGYPIVARVWNGHCSIDAGAQNMWMASRAATSFKNFCCLGFHPGNLTLDPAVLCDPKMFTAVAR